MVATAQAAPSTAPDAPADDRRRFRRSAGIGGAVGVVIFGLVTLLNHAQLMPGTVFSGFYETQARALRRGHWWIPQGSIGIEAFRIGDHDYMYFGPWPSVLRMPGMFLFHGMDGRWTVPSMFLALTVALVATVRLAWGIRGLVLADQPLARFECWLIGIYTALVAGGSVFLFLTSQAWVYHEAELWGAAAALAAFSIIFDYIRAPRTRLLVLASVFGAIAILSRPSVGFGPLAAIGLVGLAGLTGPTRHLVGLPEPSEGSSWFRSLAARLAAAGVPALMYVYVNHAKFGTWLVFPSDKQLFSQVSIYRREMLASNGNSLFGLKFFPTAFVQYLRPDALRFRSLVPFVDFPNTVHVFGNVQFDTIEPTSSVTTTMPLFFIVTMIGLVAAFWPDRGRGWSLRSIRIPIIGAICGGYTVIPYSYIGQRYVSDFMPILVIAGLCGLWMTVRWCRGRTMRIRTITTLAALLTIWSVAVNTGLAWTYHNASDLLPEGNSTAFVSYQYAVHSNFPGGRAPYVVQRDDVPYPPLARGTVLVVGDCEGVYVSVGDTWPPTSKWNAVARTKSTGEYRFRVRFDRVDRPTVEPIVVRGTQGRIQTVAAFVYPDNRVVFGFHSQGHDDLPSGPRTKDGYYLGARLKFKPGKAYNMTVIMDENNGSVSVTLAGYVGFAFQQFELTTPQLAHYVFPTENVEFGTNTVGAPTEPEFLGRLTERRIKRPTICADLTLPQNAAKHGG